MLAFPDMRKQHCHCGGHFLVLVRFVICGHLNCDALSTTEDRSYELAMWKNIDCLLKLLGFQRSGNCVGDSQRSGNYVGDSSWNEWMHSCLIAIDKLYLRLCGFDKNKLCDESSKQPSLNLFKSIVWSEYCTFVHHLSKMIFCSFLNQFQNVSVCFSSFTPTIM